MRKFLAVSWDLETVGGGDSELGGREEFGGADDFFDLVFLEEAGDAGGEGFDDYVFAGHHGFEVDAGVVDGDAHFGEVVLGEVEFFGGVEEGFGGDASDAEAGFLAEACFLVDAGGFEAELLCGRGWRRHSRRGRAADDDEVELGGGGFGARETPGSG